MHDKLGNIIFGILAFRFPPLHPTWFHFFSIAILLIRNGIFPLHIESYILYWNIDIILAHCCPITELGFRSRSVRGFSKVSLLISIRYQEFRLA